MKAVVLLLVLRIFIATASAADAPLAVLTTARQVIDLGVEGARRSPHPVRVLGVVTYLAPGKNWGFVQDDTAGLLVVFTRPVATPIFGQQVEVTGVASAGQFTTECVKSDVRVLGPATMPTARHSHPERLSVGDDCGRWVELEGRVRDMSVQPGEMTVRINSERYQFNATVVLTNPLPLPLDWLDAKVRVSGVCWTVTDHENQPAGFRIFCSSPDQLTVLEPGRADVFATPLVSPTELRQHKTNSDARIRLAGTVLMYSPGRRLYLQDDLGPVRTRLLLPFLRGNANATFVERPHLVPLAPGDRVEVVASPATTASTPLLGDAEYRKIGTGPVPMPAHRSMRQLTSGHHTGELVTLRARFLDRTSRRDGSGTEHELTLEAEGTVFQALLSTLETFTSDPLTPNSMVQLTGICSAGAGEWDRVRTMRVLLRTPADVRVLGPTPFWMLWPVGRILGGAAALGVGAMGWISLLRRRVARRTRDLEQAKEELRRALAHEKELGQLKSNFVNLVSHEFRTPLGIIMSAAENLENYLDRLQPAERSELLADIRTSTQRISGLMQEVLLLARVDAGKLACKPAPLDLRAFCERLIEEVRSSSDHACIIELTVACEALAARADEALLRHTFTNLLSNAVKYSPLGQPVHFHIARDGDSAVFTVRDTGIGIPDADWRQVFQTFHRGTNVGERPGTGLGLVIVKRCVDLHGGTLQLDSKINEGTTVTVRLPLFEKPKGFRACENTT